MEKDNIVIKIIILLFSLIIISCESQKSKKVEKIYGYEWKRSEGAWLGDFVDFENSKEFYINNDTLFHRENNKYFGVILSVDEKELKLLINDSISSRYIRFKKIKK